jgi:kinesin family protein 5
LTVFFFLFLSALVFRPLAEKQSACVVYPDAQSVAMASNRKSTFTFDRVFQPDAAQSEIFEYCQQTAIDIMNGFNGCVLVYGQTGSGKTHTMTGPDSAAIESEAQRGVLPRMVDALFTLVESAAADVEFQFRVSYVEIYMERLRDLLDPNGRPRVREDVGGRGVYLADAAAFSVTSLDDVLLVLRSGLANRAVASTLMNDASSRSHTVFMCEVRTHQCTIADLFCVTQRALIHKQQPKLG